MTSVDHFLTSTETIEPDEIEPNRDEIFDTLSNARRRAAIRYLYTSDGPVSVSDLVESITDEETTVRDSDVRDRVRASVYSSLVQSHLPKMDNYGIIEYDNESQTVRLTETGTLLVPYIERPSLTSVRWIVGYVLIAIVMGLSGIVYQTEYVELAPMSSDFLLLLYGMLLVTVATVHIFVSIHQSRWAWWRR